MTNPTNTKVCLSSIIIMHYKEQCKQEGEIVVKVKIMRLVLHGINQKDVAQTFRCSKNTVLSIMKEYNALPEEVRLRIYGGYSFTKEEIDQMTTLAHASRAPKSHSRCLSNTNSNIVLDIHNECPYGPKRMLTHIKRSGVNTDGFTLPKLLGLYKRENLKSKRIRTKNGERRALYDYTKLTAFEWLHYDTKTITDMHALPAHIYEKFKNSPNLPIYQWTIIDAKTRTRFLAYSHNLSSFFGQRFLLFAVCWLRSHGVLHHINVLFDGGREFCSASERKLDTWNTFFSPYGVTVDQTRGDKTRQNLVERSHRSDDEEFYCPRGKGINTKEEFLVEAQNWNIYWNCERPHMGINNLTPVEYLDQLGYSQAKKIGMFPTMILEDYFRELHLIPTYFEIQGDKSQNVLTHYQLKTGKSCRFKNLRLFSRSST
jgi:hypothetical protein